MDDFGTAEVLKVDAALGIVFGWAIICKKDGKPYIDLQKHHVTEEAMLHGAADFMEYSRVAKEMHSGEEAGSIVFAMPMTEEIGKAFGFDMAKQTGLMIGMKPNPEMLGKFVDGTYKGFSIGGRVKEWGADIDG